MIVREPSQDCSTLEGQINTKSRYQAVNRQNSLASQPRKDRRRGLRLGRIKVASLHMLRTDLFDMLGFPRKLRSLQLHNQD